jgi:hypothetical protein
MLEANLSVLLLHHAVILRKPREGECLSVDKTMQPTWLDGEDKAG